MTHAMADIEPGLRRAFDRDIEDNREALKRNGKLTMPVLAVGGTASTTGPLMEDMMREVASNVRAVRIAGTAHWIADENPHGFATELLGFLRTAKH